MSEPRLNTEVAKGKDPAKTSGNHIIDIVVLISVCQCQS